MTTKITDANIDSDRLDNTNFNIGLLGFKMAVNEGLTVFNLVDGVVDEFNDESGTDEAEGSNDLYNATDDYYVNSTSPTGVAFCTPTCYSAGFTTTSVTEPDTSTAGTNPARGLGTYGSFTVPTGVTSLNTYTWGAGGGGGDSPTAQYAGGGGFSTGTVSVTPGQSLTVVVGEGGEKGSCAAETTGVRGGLGGYRPNPAIAWPVQSNNTGGGGSVSACTPGNVGYTSGGGGLSGTFTGSLSTGAPVAVIIAGGGGGGEYSTIADNNNGGAAGGTDGYKGGSYPLVTGVPNNGNRGGGGSQTTGGYGAAGSQNGGGPSSPGDINGHDGGLFYGGNNALRTDPSGTYSAGGGAGYYGGGGGAWTPGRHGAGGGGSSYIGSPLVTCGSTTAADSNSLEGGGVSSPFYIPGTNDGGDYPRTDGQDGYVLLTGSGCVSTPACVQSTTIVSTAFTSSSVATNARIVVFEEDVDAPTLNTDVIASISRDGGTTFTNATLSDSGYVTGSSGQRILTGQADISGQPSGQSMRWKLALANNTIKIHGVSLQWS